MLKKTNNRPVSSSFRKLELDSNSKKSNSKEHYYETETPKVSTASKLGRANFFAVVQIPLEN